VKVLDSVVDIKGRSFMPQCTDSLMADIKDIRHMEGVKRENLFCYFVFFFFINIEIN